MESLTTGPELENPARMFMESLTTGPELENSQGQSRRLSDAGTSASPRLRTYGCDAANRRFGPGGDVRLTR
jgi:hypothetical protein